MLAARNQAQPLLAKQLAAEAPLLMAATLALPFGIYPPTHSPHGAKHQNSSSPGPSLCSQRIPVTAVRDRPMTECSACHRTAESVGGGLEDSRWAPQTHGLSLKGQVGICQDEKGKGLQAERTARAKAWQCDPPISKGTAWSPPPSSGNAEATDSL